MTSIEWLDEQLQEYVIAADHVANTMVIQISFEEYMDLKRQAKEMHKQDIITSYKADSFHVALKDAEDYYQETFVSNGSDMVEVPKQNTYTEKQVREAIRMSQTRKYNSHFYNADEIIQSLKQPKKD